MVKRRHNEEGSGEVLSGQREVHSVQSVPLE